MKSEGIGQKDDVRLLMRKLGKQARDAYRVLAAASAEEKNKALLEAAKAIRDRLQEIIIANETDMALAGEAGLGSALLDRLQLNPARIEAMAKGLEDIASFPDPIGKTLAAWERPNGLKINRVSV